MTENKLGKQFNTASLLRFVLPNTIMMVFLSLYTIVDGIFISRLVGELALSATNMFYPVTCLELAMGIMFTTGGSALIAIEMGRGDTQQAKENFTFLTAVAILVGVIFALVCIPNLEGILTRLGASSKQLPYCLIYDRWLLTFAPAMFLQILFQMFFVTAGKPHLGLAINFIGGITNMVLDYVLMGVLKLGVLGAALATGIGYCVPAVFGLIYFACHRKGTLHFTRFPLRPRFLVRTCVNGSSEMVSNVSIAVTTLLFNLISMRFWQESGVAAFTMMSYFQFVFSAVFSGFSMGIAPIISYKYGAKDQLQLRKVTRFGFAFIGIASVTTYTLSRLLLPMILEIFTFKGSPAYNIAIDGFAIYALQFLFMGLSIFSSAMFTALGNGVVSAVISMARTLIFLVSTLIILPTLLGEIGVWLAVPVAEVLGVIVSIGCVLKFKKSYMY